MAEDDDRDWNAELRSLARAPGRRQGWCVMATTIHRCDCNIAAIGDRVTSCQRCPMARTNDLGVDYCGHPRGGPPFLDTRDLPVGCRMRDGSTVTSRAAALRDVESATWDVEAMRAALGSVETNALGDGLRERILAARRHLLEQVEAEVRALADAGVPLERLSVEYRTHEHDFNFTMSARVVMAAGKAGA